MLLKKLLRTLLRYKAQFISMIIMIALGIGVFLGFNIEWCALEVNTDKIYKETGFADYRLYDTDNGFSADDLEKVLAIDGVKDATRFISLNMTVEGDTDLIALTVSSNMNVSGIKLMDGEAYDETSTDGMWLSSAYADANGVLIGDAMTLTYNEYSITCQVKGTIKSSEYLICLIDDTQLMPDYNSGGYAYVSPALVQKLVDDEVAEVLAKNPLYRLAGSERIEREKTKFLNRLYMQINVLSDMDKAAFVEAADAALGRTCLALGRDEVVSYAEAQGEIEEGKTMASILPVLFLAIAVLTMVTTMHRITANEKTQIGTLKALGFRDTKILAHYSSFALIIGIIGTVLGLGIGYLIAWYILRPEGAMGTYIDMPYWDLVAPWFTWLIIAAILVLLVLIGFLSVKKMLSGTAADALKPYTPKKMRHMAIENSAMFKKLSFGTKWNLRDCFRHKSRSFMTLFGVLGCVILLIGGLGMRDTMNDFVNKFYETAINYNVRVNLNTETSLDESDETEAEKAQTRQAFNERAKELNERLQGDWSAQAAAQIGDKAYQVEIYNVEHDKVRFLDDDLNVIELGDEGVYICARMERDLKLSTGDELSFSPYGSDKTYTVKIAGVMRSLTEGLVMSEAYANQSGIDYTITTIYTDDENTSTDPLIHNRQTKKAIMDSFDSFMELMNVMVFLLVLAAVILGVVVLYNLGVMSYVERYREMATLKVIGFRDAGIGKLLITQNIWLTVLGLALGIPIGVGVLSYLITALAGEYEMRLVVSVWTYVFTIVLTFGVSLLVGLMIARKNKRIDMVAALKTEE